MAGSSNHDLHGPSLSRARGRIQREIVPRGANAEVAPRPGSFDPVTALVEQAEGRVDTLLPIRYGRMAADEFGFLRGAASLMAADLAAGPSSDLSVQLCGDAHLANFGVFLSPEHRIVFDVNDFDETHVGPFEWDVKRLAASIAVAGSGMSLSRTQCERAVASSVAQYRATMRTFAGARNFDVWYARADLGSALGDLSRALAGEDAQRVEDVLALAGRKRSHAPYERLVVATPDGPKIATNPPLLVPVSQLTDEADGDPYQFLIDVLRGYESSLADDRRHLLHQFAPADAARKVVGVGSVGMRCYVVLLLGRDAADPFFLQVKEATASVLETHLGPSKYASPGQRVVAGQELIQATPDPFLGFLDVADADGGVRSFYVRQLFDGKASADLASFDGSMLRAYASLCGWALARAHARSGDRFAIASYLGKSSAFDDAVTSFATSYVARNRDDRQALLDAIASGRVPASAP
jgi:uncharacterized protein (DUF2252 family)